MTHRHSHLGRVESFTDKTAFVSLLDRATGEHSEAECDRAIIPFPVGAEFFVTVTGGGVIITFIPPKTPTKQELDQISSQVDSVLL